MGVPAGSVRAMRIPTYHDIAQRIGDARAMRLAMNAWPPFAFAGIRVTRMDDDYRHVDVVLRKHRLTSNYVNTQFGGSLFAMTDPFWMIMIMNNLGRDYVVWDKAAQIEYVTPGRTDVTASFTLTQADLDDIRAQTADGAKHLRWFDNDVVDADGAVVARVRKQVYVRRKPGR